MPSHPRFLAKLPLTGSGRTAVVWSMVTYLVGWRLGWDEAMVLSAAGLLALVLAIPFVIGRRQLEVRRTLRPERVTVGEPAVAVLTVANSGRSGGRAEKLHEFIGGEAVEVDISGLLSSQSLEVLHPIPTARRGVIEIGPSVVSKSDPLGLMRRSASQTGIDQLWVQPRIVPVDPVPIGYAMDLESPTSDSSPAGDVSFHALREYEVGDDHRHVHWLSTARTGDLMVRHYVDNRQPAVTVLLDDVAQSFETPDLDLDSFEIAVEVAASISASSLSRQQTVAVRVGQQPVASHSRRGDIDALFKELTIVAPTGSSPLKTQVGAALEHERDTSVLVVVSGQRDAEELLPIVDNVGRRAHLVFVRVGPELSEQLAAVPGVATLDVSSLGAFQARWNRSMS